MIDNKKKYNYVICQDMDDNYTEIISGLDNKGVSKNDRVISEQELPLRGFDLQRTVAVSLEEFGEAPITSDLGNYVRFIGEAVIEYSSGESVDMSGIVGRIVSKAHDRIIMLTDKGFFGWINPNEYEKLTVIENRVNYVN